MTPQTQAIAQPDLRVWDPNGLERRLRRQRRVRLTLPSGVLPPFHAWRP
ncbi:hypothetical protein [Thermaurantiacus tibetensis]|nr:hypothetical protein [Thermaurantiacus tibetensis]